MAVKDLVFTVLGIDRASKTFNDVGRSMNRLSNVGTKSMAALLGSSLAASAGIAAALGGMSVVFAGTAAAALSQNAAVANSFRDLGASMKSGLAEDAGILEDEMVGAAHEINTAFQDLRPQLREAFIAAQPQVDNLVDGVTGFAREAMPGMVTAVKSAGPVMEGLEDLLKDSGRATTDFLEVVSKGAPNAGTALHQLGDLVQGVLPNVGEMLVNLTGLWVEHGDQVVRVITGITDVVSDLSASALPTLSDGIGVALDVLEGLLHVIEPMSGVLGPLIGMWLSLSLALRGLSAVRGVVDSVGGSIRGLREDFAKTPTAAGKMGKAIGGVMGLLGGPWGLAVAGATALLAVFGQEAETNAQDQRNLADALRDSGGAFDQAARKAIVQSDAYQEVAGSIDAAGISQRDYLDAVIDGGSKLDDLEKRLRAVIKAGTEYGAVSKGGQVRNLSEEAQAAEVALRGLDGLRQMVVGAIEDFNRQQEAVAGVAASMVGARPGADSLAEALGVLSDKTADAAGHADALNTAWQQLLGVHLTLEQATSKFEGDLDTISKTFDSAKQATDNWRGALFDANGQVNLSTEAGRQLSANLVAAGEDYRALAQTAYDTTLQRTGSEWQATIAAVAATQQRRAQFIAEATELTGNAELATELANRYFGLPDDVLTLIRADSSNAQGIVDDFVSKNNNRSININVMSTYIQRKGGKIFEGLATGGRVTGREPIRVGERGEELFWPDGPGTIIPHDATRRFLSDLRANRSTVMDSGPAYVAEPVARPAISDTLRAMAEAGYLGAGGRTQVSVNLAAGPGADSGAGQWIQSLVRRGILKLKVDDSGRIVAA